MTDRYHPPESRSNESREREVKVPKPIACCGHSDCCTGINNHPCVRERKP